jgi:hypothetical protein
MKHDYVRTTIMKSQLISKLTRLIVKKSLLALLIFIVAACGPSFEVQHMGTENMEKKEFARLSVGNSFDVSVDNRKFDHHYKGYNREQPYIIGLKPGNHVVKYTFEYSSSFRPQNFPGTFSSSYSFIKKGELFFTFKKGKQYYFRVKQTTPALIGSALSMEAWEKIYNSNTSVSIY